MAFDRCKGRENALDVAAPRNEPRLPRVSNYQLPTGKTERLKNMNEIATLGGFSLDLVEEPKQRPPIVRFKKGEYLTPLVNDGQDDIRGALFAVALPTYRHTWTAWSSENKPLEDREAFLCFGEKPATADMLTRHPMRETKDGPVDPWQEGLKMDGFLNVMDGWHPATFAVGSRTAIIAMQSAFSEIKKHQRTFPVSDWTPIWELKGGGKFKSEKFGDIHVPDLQPRRLYEG